VPRRVPETLRVVVFPDPAVLGGVGRLTATLGDPLDTGRIVWSGAGAGGLLLGPRGCRPAAGTCSVAWRPARAGQWTLAATWSGDRTHLPASASKDLTARRGRVVLRLAAAPRPLPWGS
jgi:hypothetical protein